MSTPRDLSALLHAWTTGHDPHVRAAIELLLDDGVWLQRPGFFSRFVHVTACEALIDFQAVDKALNDRDDVVVTASSTEVGTLRFATDLALDRWRASRMGGATSQALRTAFTTATA